MQPCPRMEEDGTGYASPFKFGEPEWRDNGTCSYCGSMSPTQFFRAIEAGAEIGPTDKNYKVYVDGGPDDWNHGKFYFQHLDEPDKRRFIDLYNEGVMNLGYPGNFYTRPFFVSDPRADKVEA